MSTEVARQAEKPVIAMLAKYQGQIEAVLPKHLTPTRVLKMIVGAINKNPKLLNCTPMSVINAVLTASQMGLEIGPGSCYLVPFGKDCTLLVDYRGKIDMALRSGKVIDIDLEVVFSKEKFRIYRDENGRKRLEHETMTFKEGADGEHLPITEKDRGIPIGAYALAVLKDGPPKIVFMPAIDIDAIKRRSRAANDGPWVTDPMEMWKKTVCHRICKTLPMSAEKFDQMRMSQEVDDRFEMGESLDQIISSDAEDDVPMLPGAGNGSVQAALASHEKMADIGEKLAAASTAPAKTDPQPTDKAPWKERTEMYKFMSEMSSPATGIGKADYDRLMSEHKLDYSKMKFDAPETLACYRAMQARLAEIKKAPATDAPAGKNTGFAF